VEEEMWWWVLNGRDGVEAEAEAEAEAGWGRI
jgi:hypothetical protein